AQVAGDVHGPDRGEVVGAEDSVGSRPSCHERAHGGPPTRACPVTPHHQLRAHLVAGRLERLDVPTVALVPAIWWALDHRDPSGATAQEVFGGGPSADLVVGGDHVHVELV